MEAISSLLGAILITAGIALLITTTRAATSGRRAYHANKRLTSENPIASISGRLNVAADIRERRSCSGMAVTVSSGELVRQEKLSAEALDEVIGRQL